MKRNFCICCLLILVLLITGCSNINPAKSGKTVAFDKYTLHYEKGNSYITINTPINEKNTSDIAFLDGILFDSVGQFVETVTNGKLTESQLEIADHAFLKDEQGKIKIIDISNVHTLNTPADLTCEGVFWSGESYSLKLSSNNQTFAVAHFYSDNGYQSRFNAVKSFDNPLITQLKTESQNGKNINYFSTSQGKFKNIDYIIQKGNIKYTVIEWYNLSTSDESLKCSDTIPFEVNIFYESDDCKCVIDLFEMENAPTDLWIFDFVAKQYNNN